nr:kinesin-like protein KIN-7E [Tanacetum cinerariifolium]
LVKHLQKELARLENELRTPAPPDYSALLKKKDQQIEKLEKEVRDLIKQRDLAESRIKELLLAVRNDQTSTQWLQNQLTFPMVKPTQYRVMVKETTSEIGKGKHGHVNYRDSKLTRILQPCLGGNARTAIICTLSPAREHVEQSKNTLLFASCAKEVTTNAQVNVVMSDKALVKHLQKELARLENELRTPAPPDYSA